MRVLLVAALLPTLLPSVAAGDERAASERAGVVAVFWQPPGTRAFDAAARAAFADAVKPLGARLIDASAAPVLRQAGTRPPSLVPALDAAKDDYAKFKFADAVGHLDQVQRLADARGGGDLDARQLSEIFLYRGLCRLETGADDAAWDDLVRAAELDPSRVMDPARFPPRAVAAFKRAAGEVARQAKLPLELDVPAGAPVDIRIDGVATTGAVTLGAGQHFVAVAAEGFEPWSGLVTVPAARDRFTPPLHAYAPPDADQLVALAGDAHEIFLGAVERHGSGWRFSARRITLPEGTFVADAVILGDLPVRVAVAGVMNHVMPAPQPKQAKRRWLTWTLVGGAVAVAAVAVTLGVVLGSPAPSVSGTLP